MNTSHGTPIKRNTPRAVMKRARIGKASGTAAAAAVYQAASDGRYVATSAIAAVAAPIQINSVRSRTRTSAAIVHAAISTAIPISSSHFAGARITRSNGVGGTIVARGN